MYYQQKNLFVSGTDGYHTYRIPALVRSNDGTILLFVRGGSLVVVMLVILICYLNEVLMVVIHGQIIRLLCMVMGILRETQLR